MKIQIASDLHLEFLHQRFAGQHGLQYAAGADVLVLAGDIHKEDRALKAFADWPVPVIYVYGNHEMYGAHIHQETDKLRGQTRGSNIHFLERDEFTLDGVRFLGTALWTDFHLFGADQANTAMALAEAGMNDYAQIRTHYRKLRPVDTVALHRASRAWLEEKLAEPFEGSTVVVTHHGPHPGSVPTEYRDDLLSAAYSSDLTDLMGKATLWIHGHVHTSLDYVINGTRIVANPRGYPQHSAKRYEEIRWENHAFNPTMVVDV